MKNIKISNKGRDSMTAAILISSVAVIGAVAVGIKKFDENGQEIIDSVKENIKELIKKKDKER
jgi:hypothetical protein